MLMIMKILVNNYLSLPIWGIKERICWKKLIPLLFLLERYLRNQEAYLCYCRRKNVKFNVQLYF